MTTTTTAPALSSIVDIYPMKLSVIETHEGGEQRSLFYKADPDLTVKLAKGGDDLGQHARGGLVLIALSVDGEHDEVSVEVGPDLLTESDALTQARKSLALVEKALQRVSDTSGPDA